MQFARQLAPALFGAATIVLVQSQFAAALSPDEISNRAKAVTVLIEGGIQGSGVIIAKEGSTYYVLTAQHIISDRGTLRVQTPDNRKYDIDVNNIIELPGVDLAIAQFTSTTNYAIAELGNSDTARVAANVYVSGWPEPSDVIRESIHQLTVGQISAIQAVQDGYGLIYTNPTRRGMSGGPVLDENGQVIAIHGRTDGDISGDVAKAWVSLGIPINRFFELAPQAYANQGQEKLSRQDYDGAIADFNQGLSFNNRSAVAYMGRGYAQFARGNTQLAIEDASKAIQYDANLANAYLLRGASYAKQGNHTQAIEDFDRAISRNNQLAIAYGLRGISKAETRDYIGANTDIQQLLSLNPNSPLGYTYLSQVRERTGDRVGAEEAKQKAAQLANNLPNTDSYHLVLIPNSILAATNSTPRTPPNNPSATNPPPRPPTNNPSVANPPSRPPTNNPSVTNTPSNPPNNPSAANPTPRTPPNNPPVANTPVAFNENSTLIALRTSIPEDAAISAVAISPDGKSIAVGKKGGYVEIRDTETGQVRMSLSAHVRGIRSLAFSPDGTMLATGGEDVEAKLWDLRTGNIVHRFDAVNAQVHSVAFTPSGQSLVAGLGNGKVMLWLVGNGQVFREITTELGGVYSVAVSPDGTMLATGGANGTLKIWSLPDGQLLRTLTGHTGIARGLAFAPDGKTLISGGFDDQIRLWNPDTGELQRSPMNVGEFIYAIAVSPDGRVFASASTSKVALWNLSTGDSLGAISASARSVTFGRDGRTLIGGGEEREVKIWQVRQ